MWEGIPSGDTKDKIMVRENSESQKRYSSCLHRRDTICYTIPLLNAVFFHYMMCLVCVSVGKVVEIGFIFTFMIVNKLDLCLTTSFFK